MRFLTDDSTDTVFCVVVHDVTTVFTAEIDQILDALEPLLGNRLVGGVVPRWHGHHVDGSARQQFGRWSERFGDVMLHGWTHHRKRNRGLVSWCTDGADEFGRCSIADIVERLCRAQTDIHDLLGRELSGFIPPAWRLAAKIEDIQPAGIAYLMRFGSLEPLRGPPIPLATWSWDWGWLPGIHVAGAALGSWRQWMNPQSVPVIALHPIDVRRGRLQPAVQLIRRFRSSGRLPVMPCELLAANTLSTAP